MSLHAKHFSKEQILQIHKRLIERFGGSHGVLSEHMLESTMGALEMACHYQTLSTYQIAAKYAHRFIQNHCFIDGNKRIGPALGITYIRLNQGTFSASNAEVVSMALAVAQGEMDEEHLADWFKRFSSFRSP
ncbi:MAG: type II toxin-antitoxin system death-on-curing family toxin [Candidatus Sericytochromatia bacterium]